MEDILKEIKEMNDLKSVELFHDNGFEIVVDCVTKEGVEFMGSALARGGKLVHFSIIGEDDD